jgi:hypothetical protein
LGGTKGKRQNLDEEGEFPIVIGNLAPIACVVHEKTIMFVNESL